MFRKTISFISVASLMAMMMLSLPANVGAEPVTNKDDCKKGGWMNFTNPTFKNQGDCVSFVASGGKANGNPEVLLGSLNLYEKTPKALGLGLWDIVVGGAGGRMEYNLSGPTFDFVLNGHKLVPESNYTLIYYPDNLPTNPWPRTGIICLGNGTANLSGNVNISGSVDTGTDLPAVYDSNSVGNVDYGMAGAKIWLVESADVNCTSGVMSGWNPTEYLFEGALINFDDTNASTASLVLENKNVLDWSVISDSVGGILNYQTSGDEFNYSFSATVNTPSINYTLLYVGPSGDWPGVGSKVIGSGLASAGGAVTLSGNPNLGVDIINGKVWLVPSSTYDVGTNLFTGWDHVNNLYEANLISYDDTNI